MKRNRPFSMLLTCTLVAGMALLGPLAQAQGPRTPVEAFNRLQGNAHTTRSLQTKPLLHTHSTTPLLKTPGTKQLVRGQSKTVVRPNTKVVNTHEATKLDTTKLFGKTTTLPPSIKPAAKPAARPSWLGRIFAGIFGR